MTFAPNRREFVVGSSTFLGSLCLASDAWLLADVPSVTEKRMVLQGLNALARAPEMNYFTDGHRGASMISAHLMCVDNDLGDAAATRIVELFDRNWASSKLCEPFPEMDPVPDAAERIGKVLAAQGKTLREVGHDVIFAMHAIKGFRMLPEAATPGRVEGVCNLIRAMKPWRDVEPDPSIQPPPFADAQQASRFILQEASAAIDRFVGYGQGFAGHMLTFGQSLVELAAMGDVEWAESCRIAFCKYVTVTRQGPSSSDRKIAAHPPSKLRPKDTAYWQKRGDKTLGIGHVFKYPYAYYDLLARAQDPELAASLDAKAYQLF